jgi:hypothetical protein
MNLTVTFVCRSNTEAACIRDAVSRYARVLREAGTDLRNYAPASEGGAGFDWDAVRRAAGDMHRGSVTYMSRRMALAIFEALTFEGVAPDAAARLDDAIERAGRPASKQGFFQPGRTYSVRRGGPDTPEMFRFRCRSVTQHPGTGELLAVGEHGRLRAGDGEWIWTPDTRTAADWDKGFAGWVDITDRTR